MKCYNHRDKVLFRLAMLTCASAGAMSASVALAQQSSVADSADAAMPEIVVTAQKREEKLKDIPLSVSAVSGEYLVKRGVKDIVELANVVPSLSVYPVSPGQNLLSIRGISTFRGDSALVGTYLDEIPLSGGIRLGDGAGLAVQALDLARVEVLKGPQGTLFGEGAIGGVVRYISADPELDQFKGNIKGAYFATRHGAGSGELSGMLNVPIVSDVLGVRAALTYQNHGGWINNIGTGVDDYNSDELGEVRIKVLYTPSEKLTLTGLVDIHRLNYDGQNLLSVQPYDKSLFKQSAFLDYPTDGYNDFDLYNVTGSYDFGFATLLSSTSYFNLRVSNSFGWISQIIPGKGDPTVAGGGWEVLIPPNPGKQTSFSQELRLTSNGNGPFKWVVGVNYKDTRTKIRSISPIATYFKISDDPNVPLVTENYGGYHASIPSKAKAIFGDASYEFFDKLEIGGGLRHFIEKRSRLDVDRFGAVTGDLSGTFKKTTYRAFAKYKLTKEVNLYANTATGFRSGGFNIPASIAFGAPSAYDPESARFYEAGIKSSFLNGKVTFDLAYYTGKYIGNVQAVFRFDNAGHGYGYFANAGDANIKGVEWALNVSPVRDLRLGFSGNVPKTKFTKSSPSSPVLPGDPIDFVPKYELMANAAYDFKWAPEVDGFFSINGTWKGRQQNTNRDSGVGYVINIGPNHTWIDASLGAEFNGYRVIIFGKNLMDELGILAPQFSGIRPQARPRQIGFSLEKSF